MGMVILLLLAPVVARGQGVPEDLLPGGTQVYLRWDGVAAHRPAYDKSALGQMLQGDTGKFVSSVFDQLQQLLSSGLVEELLKGTPPEILQRIQEDATRAPKLVGLLGEHGIILAVEVRSMEPPDGQVTVILPDAAPGADALLASIHLAATLTKQEIKERKVEGRTVHQLTSVPIPVAWWVEGKHILLTGGTSLPETVIKHITDQKDRLTDNPLFKKVAGFKDFETGTRAFVDGNALAKLGSKNKIVARLVDELGLDSVKNLTLFSGFDGATEHGLMELELAGKRQGVLRLLDGKPFHLADVPVLPADAVSWSMTNFDPKVAYDEGLRTAETVLGAAAPDELPKLKEYVKQVDESLGINVRKDLLGSLGDQYVQYLSPTDGPVFLGQTYVVKVKDPDQLAKSLEQALKGIAKSSGVDISVKKRPYHGAMLHEVHVRQQGFFFLPTYAIHKGWLVASYYPQAVQSYILRAKGELPAWKPDARTREALEKLPKDVISISVSDPRPTIKQVLALTPVIGAAVNSSFPGGGSVFDVGLVPNGHEATRHLFPNVSVVTVDEHVLRMETRASLALPVELGNSDTLFLGFLLSVSRVVVK
jgi:hypothetical protein